MLKLFSLVFFSNLSSPTILTTIPHDLAQLISMPTAVFLPSISPRSVSLDVKSESSDVGKSSPVAGDDTESVTVVTQIIPQTIIIDTFAATSTIDVRTLSSLAKHTTQSTSDLALNSASSSSSVPVMDSAVASSAPDLVTEKVSTTSASASASASAPSSASALSTDKAATTSASNFAMDPAAESSASDFVMSLLAVATGTADPIMDSAAEASASDFVMSLLAIATGTSDLAMDPAAESSASEFVMSLLAVATGKSDLAMDSAAAMDSPDLSMNSVVAPGTSDLAMDSAGAAAAAATGVVFSNTYPTAHFKSVQYKDGIAEYGTGSSSGPSPGSTPGSSLVDDLGQDSAVEATMTAAGVLDGLFNPSVFDQIGAVKTVPFPPNPPPAPAYTDFPVHEPASVIAGQGVSLNVQGAQYITAAGYESAQSVPTSNVPVVVQSPGAPSLAPPQPSIVQATGLATRVLAGLALPIVPFFAVLLHVVL